MVIERASANREHSAAQHIALQTQIDDFDQKTMLWQIELWSSRIIPAVRK